MRSALITAWTVLLALAAGSCIYTSDGIYSVEPVPGDKAIVTVSTNLDTMQYPAVNDSLDLEVTYRFTVEKGEPYMVDCLLEDLPVHDIGFYYDGEQIYLTHLDSLFTVESDTTVLLDGTDTAFAFVRDVEHELYTLTGTFSLQALLPVQQGNNTLYMSFYYSANTNSLADLMRLEADVTDRMYTVWIERGGSK
jgi:hypothetical protein